MEFTDDTMQVDRDGLKRVLNQKTELAARVKSVVDSDGYLVLKAFFNNFIADIKNKPDYDSLEDYRADRKAIVLVQGILNDFESCINDGEIAASQLIKLTNSDDQTPSLLSLDGEGVDDGEGRDSE